MRDPKILAMAELAWAHDFTRVDVYRGSGSPEVKAAWAALSEAEKYEFEHWTREELDHAADCPVASRSYGCERSREACCQCDPCDACVGRS